MNSNSASNDQGSSDPMMGVIDAYLDGDIDSAGVARLSAWLQGNKENARVFARRVCIHRQLRETILVEQSVKCLGELEDQAACDEDVCGDSHAISASPALPIVFPEIDATRPSPLQWPLFLAALVVVVALTATVAYQLGRTSVGDALPRPAGQMLAGGDEKSAPFEAPAYVGRLVNLTNCRWDRTRTTADFTSGGLLPGQALHLLEGVAEIESTLRSGCRGTFQLEGPVAMMMSSEGMPNLLYGKLAAIFTCDFDRFMLDTPLGRVIVASDASIGVMASTNEVELHVLAGAATFEFWSRGLNVPAEAVRTEQGSSLRARIDSEGHVVLSQGKARDSWFITPQSIAANRLAISSDYVAAVQQAKPIGYWRFEAEQEGLVKNEMADRFHLRMVGDAVRLRQSPGNRVGEFGVTSGPGYLISDDTLDGAIGDDCSVEAWVKPGYYHHGALFSLIRWSPEMAISPQGRHRLHVELCGPVSGYWNSIRPPDEHPGRIRLLINGSQQCFSSSPYLLRQWQHLAAVKEGKQLRLFVDGELAAEGQTAYPTLGDGLRILIGQLYPRNEHIQDEVTARLFVGEMDELALYDRALDLREIKSHHRAARHKVENRARALQPADS